MKRILVDGDLAMVSVPLDPAEAAPDITDPATTVEPGLGWADERNDADWLPAPPSKDRPMTPPQDCVGTDDDGSGRRSEYASDTPLAFKVCGNANFLSCYWTRLCGSLSILAVHVVFGRGYARPGRPSSRYSRLCRSSDRESA